MKHHDSINQANKIMSQAVKQLQLWHLAATPINYAVSYEYVIGNNKPLVSAVRYQLAAGKKLDNFYVEEVYQQFVLGQSKFRDEILTDIDNVIDSLEKGCNDSAKVAADLISSVDSNIVKLDSSNQKDIKGVVKELKQASVNYKIAQTKLVGDLRKQQQHTQRLHKEVEQAQDSLYLDPLTGLYNRKAMSKYIESWHKADPNKSVAAIVINVDDFSDVTQKFGTLIGDVLLTKIAAKVSSYVDESGLPIRSSGDEFLILLPDVERNIAGEIAEKIRQGVEKLRFVSSKSGVRLPKMTVSVGVNGFKVSENINTMMTQTRGLVEQIQRTMSNQVKIVSS